MEGDVAGAQHKLNHSLSLHRAWLGLGSTATATVKILLDSLKLLGPGQHTLSPEAARALLAEAQAAAGPDSLPVGEAAAHASWLLYLGGHSEEAVGLMRLAQRVLHAWHGPENAMSDAVAGLLRQMRSGSLDNALGLVHAAEPEAPPPPADAPRLRATLTVVEPTPENAHREVRDFTLQVRGTDKGHQGLLIPTTARGLRIKQSSSFWSFIADLT